MWWRYLSKSHWGRSRTADKPIVSLIVLFPRRERMQWEELLVYCLWPARKSWPEKEKRWGQGKWPCRLRFYNSQERVDVGLGQACVQNLEENRFRRFPKKIPGPKCCEGRCFHWEDMRLTKNHFKPHSCNFWFLRVPLSLFFLHPVLFSQKIYSNEEKRGKSLKKQ